MDTPECRRSLIRYFMCVSVYACLRACVSVYACLHESACVRVFVDACEPEYWTCSQMKNQTEKCELFH